MLTREEFADQVKDALQHLYDLAYLPSLDLASLLAGGEYLSWHEQTQRVRRTLTQAIERLDPGSHLPLRARERRSYAILSGRYVRSLTTQAVIGELAISERQYWRDRKRALKALVDQLWADYGRPAQEAAMRQPSQTVPEDIAREEADLLVAHSSPEELSLSAIVGAVASDMEKLTVAKQIRLRVEGTGRSLLVHADRTLLRQVFISLLSHAIQVATKGTILLQLAERAGAVDLIISAPGGTTPVSGASPSDVGLSIVERLVEAQAGRIEITPGQEPAWRAVVTLPAAASHPILVVDDNEAIIKLFQRYLNGTHYRIVGASTGAEALKLLGQIRPAAITLDVMMPLRDGWETLQTLKAAPELHGVPIIVCSILDEPELAYSLGADDFLRKPISREDLLQALDRWVSQRGGTAPKRPTGTGDT